MQDTSRQPIFNVPASVLWMLGLLAAVHLVRQFLSEAQDIEVVLSGAFIPVRYGDLGRELPGGTWAWFTSPFTHMLLHADVMHIAMNGVWLLAFGAAVAKRIGGLGFWLFSILTGLAGIALHMAFNWNSLQAVIGASGAVSGMTAAALRFFFAALRFGAVGDMRNNPKAVPLMTLPQMARDPQILVVIAIWLSLNVGIGLAGSVFTGGPGIAWQTHVGGFIAGLLLFGPFDRWFRPAAAGRRRTPQAEEPADDPEDPTPPPNVTYH